MTMLTIRPTRTPRNMTTWEHENEVLMPGGSSYLGEITDIELAHIRFELRADKRLMRRWGLCKSALRKASCVRRVALWGDPDFPEYNRLLVRARDEDCKLLSRQHTLDIITFETGIQLAPAYTA
jgi:hypothetical protein